MGLCVALQPDGTLAPTGQPLADCTGYVLVTPVEAAQLTIMQQLFELPDPLLATEIFTVVVGSIIGAFVMGRAFSTPANIVR